ncbi:hypothetical protein [Halalkalibacterium halodurans]|uniref:hypothetical protein n=1 Tax=Halalkalibacterium halodurans TaxID=86665 RepID=UPI0010FD01AB|nr:hypothetical protein [Halalkalibacterium halodurans]
MSIEFGVLVAIGGLVISYLAYQFNRTKDVKSDATESAVVRTKLDAIGQGVESIRIDLKANEMRMSEISERVTRVEESTKSAHRRIDQLKGEGKK